jgi:hypothetical protein
LEEEAVARQDVVARQVVEGAMAGQVLALVVKGAAGLDQGWVVEGERALVQQAVLGGA